MSTYSGGVPMVKIDGSRVKSLREIKGLTQLYLATAVDVTTDTISRWENKRYPMIKRENALKLAEVLEVPILEILDECDEPVVGDESLPPLEKQGESPSKRWPFFLGLFLVLIAIGASLWSLWPPKSIEMGAVRIVPPHVVPGMLFPVVIKVDVGTVPASFILKEIIPENCSLEAGTSFGAVFDSRSRELKWLTKSKTRELVLGYMLRSNANLKSGDTIDFSGRITQRRARGEAHLTAGRSAVLLSSYHWADINENGVIDDEEILAVYDDFNEINGISLNMDLIEEIWFGSGYRWESKSKQFVVIP